MSGILNPTSVALRGDLAEALPRAISHTQQIQLRLSQENPTGTVLDLLETTTDPFILYRCEMWSEHKLAKIEIRPHDENGQEYPSPNEKIWLTGRYGGRNISYEWIYRMVDRKTPDWHGQEYQVEPDDQTPTIEYLVSLRRPMLFPNGARIFMVANAAATDDINGYLYIGWVAQTAAEQG